MEKQKQIEEMAKYCCNPCEMSWGCDSGYCSEKGRDAYKTCSLAKETAERLYNAGYCKESETAKDILKLVKENNNGYEGDMDRLEKAIREQYGIGGDHGKEES